jgi:sterol desaturase/sphingolipid hydroxylase (fatty acid hydroxylase superfamily)
MPLPDFVADNVRQALELGLLAVGFFMLALVVKGVRAVDDGRAALPQTRSNLALYVIDALTISPAIALASASFYGLLHAPGAIYAGEAIWAKLPPVVTGVAAVFICDFFGYCNHRLYHTAWLWPSHAIHHSDTHLTWFSLVRLHPFDRFGALFDVIGLILLGLPDWAVVTAVLVRHYWGHLIHADLPWTLGPLNWIFISPAMHRFHHALEQRGAAGVNFATVFSVFDRLFGTFYAPGVCKEPTGVDDVIAPGLTGQYLHPLRVWLTPFRTARATPPAA